MIALWKSKEQRFRKVADISFEVLHQQRVFVDKDKFVIVDPKGNINGKALGYVFGFFDALLQSAKLDIRETEGEAAVHSLLARLFPAEVAKTGTYVAHLRNMQDDAEIMNGVMLGGKQATDWLRHKALPVRWATCFSEELARLAEERDKRLS
jgi:hypothetical protein